MASLKHNEMKLGERCRVSRGLRSSMSSAYGLIEFIGVFAVLTILCAAVLPVVVRRVDRGAFAKETGDMGAISNALVLQVLKTTTIPNETNWANSVANWTIRSTSQISTNNRKYARLFFYDSAGWMTNATFTQTTNGTAAFASFAPTNARVAIVSTIGKALPYLNGALATTNFNSLWNAVQGITPSYLKNQGWTGNPYDLVIQKVTLDPLFHHLILANRDPVTVPYFSINSIYSTNTVKITNNAAGWNSYYLDGTVVGLWVGTTLTNRFILTRDTSLTFENGAFNDQPTGSGTDNTGTAQAFALQAATFISTAQIPGLHQGADTQGALSSFYSFMYSYVLWANKCPHFVYYQNQGQNDADWQILDTLGHTSSGIIDGSTGSGGLIK